MGWILLLATVGRCGAMSVTSRRYWLAGAIALRVVLLPASASDDVYRYVWEGRIQNAGFSPYLTAPTDEPLVSLRNDEWRLINHPDHPGIYPPAAQLFFRAVTFVSESARGMKIALVLCDIGLLLLLARLTRDPEKNSRAVAAYGFCPLVLTAIAIEGHLDSLMLLFCGSAFVAADRERWKLVGVFLGLAASAKVVALALLGWVGLRRPAVAVVALLVFALTYVPFAGSGFAGAGNLVGFGITGEPFFGLLPTLLGEASGSAIVRWAALGAFGLAALWIVRKASALRDFSTRSFEALLPVLPVVHPWYLTWTLCGRTERLPVRLVVGVFLIVVYYEAERLRTAAGTWSMPAWAPLVFWCGYLAVWLVTLRPPAVRRVSRTSF